MSRTEEYKGVTVKLREASAQVFHFLRTNDASYIHLSEKCIISQARHNYRATIFSDLTACVMQNYRCDDATKQKKEKWRRRVEFINSGEISLPDYFRNKRIFTIAPSGKSDQSSSSALYPRYFAGTYGSADRLTEISARRIATFGTPESPNFTHAHHCIVFRSYAVFT